MKNSILFLMITYLLQTGCSQIEKEQPVSEEKINKSQATVDAKTQEALRTRKINSTMHPQLSNYIEAVVADMEMIPQEWKKQLKKIALFVQTKKQSNEPANLTFICTHNSRRSHMSQIWTATAAAYYGIDDRVNTYSGGTEITAFNEKAVAAMQRAGFKIENPGGANPHYQITYNEDGQTLECFSKKYDDPSNANENFVAVMTCSEADKNCPFIPGATLRVPIPYVDPKEADDTAEEIATYDKRCKQIAIEMFYMMSQVKV